jgi:uncharacterized membrane protein
MRCWIALIAALGIGLPVAAADWDIQDYKVDVTVLHDGTMKVVETLDVDFTRESHHGIYRLIPIKYEDRLGSTFKYRFSLDSVTDQNGSPYQVNLTREGRYVKVRVGDPSKYVQGRAIYNISYTIHRGIRFFDTSDELYWNAVGPEWDVPILAASCTVHLPQKVDLKALSYNCFTGACGSQERAAVMDPGDGQHLFFQTARELWPREGFTVFVAWPKGIVKEPEKVQRMGWFMADNGMWFIPIVILIGIVQMWRRRGKDPSTGRSVATAYDPPDNLLPAEVGTLIDEHVNPREYSATIVDLAVRGYIRIEAIKEKRFLFEKTDYQLVKLKDPDDQLTPFEVELMEDVFSGLDSRLVSDLANRFYTHIPALKDKLYQRLIANGYFDERPDKVRAKYIGLGIAVIVLGVAVGVVAQSLMWGFALGLSGLVVLAFSNAMPRRTGKGASAFLGIKGFEDYLSTAEKSMIEYQERQGYFERYLPYAIVLNVANQWARAFEGITSQPPDWYSGPIGTTFSPSAFAHDMTTASTQISSGLTSSPSSSGGGGGGFSGGGGGGGGGGAW